MPPSQPATPDQCFWAPDLPPEGLVCRDFHITTKPVRWRKYSDVATMILFGGKDGQHLSKLIKIVVWTVSRGRIYGIDFVYDTEVDGKTVITLGRSGPFDDDYPRPEYDQVSSGDAMFEFEVDGPNGERLVGVDFRAEGTALYSFKVSQGLLRRYTKGTQGVSGLLSVCLLAVNAAHHQQKQRDDVSA